MAQNTGPPRYASISTITGIIKRSLSGDDIFHQVSSIPLTTGSSLDLITRDLVNQLGLVTHPLPVPKHRFCKALGVQAKAWTNLDLYISGVHVNLSLSVTEAPLQHAIMLGVPGIEAFRAVLDPHNQLVTVSPGEDASGRALRYVAPIDIQLPPSCVTRLTLSEGRAAAYTLGKSPEQFMAERAYAASLFAG